MTAPSHAGQVIVYEVSTGAALSRWPVDARELVASGAFTMDAPETTAPAQEAPAVAPVPESDPSPRARRRGR